MSRQHDFHHIIQYKVLVHVQIVNDILLCLPISRASRYQWPLRQGMVSRSRPGNCLVLLLLFRRQIRNMMMILAVMARG